MTDVNTQSIQKNTQFYSDKTIPLTAPARWCHKQICNALHNNSSNCMAVATRVAKFIIAILAMIPCMLLALVGLCCHRVCKIKISQPSPNPSPIHPPSTSPLKRSLTPPPKPTETSIDDLHRFSGDEFLQAALQCFALPEVQNCEACNLDLTQSLSIDSTEHEIIDKILSGQRGFCVGEEHDNLAAKKFFIENMAYLKSKGVKVLFIEGITFRFQGMLDKYMSDEYLKNSDDCIEATKLMEEIKTIWSRESGEQDYKVIEEAKKHGIRVVAIDYGKSLEGRMRILRMNYLAYRIMHHELRKLRPNDKFAAFVGWGHLCRQKANPDVPGVSELFQCPAIAVRDRTRAQSADRFVIYDTMAMNDCVGKIHANIFR